MGLCFAMFVFLTFRGPLASHDSNPYPNRSRIARYNATKHVGSPEQFSKHYAFASLSKGVPTTSVWTDLQNLSTLRGIKRSDHLEATFFNFPQTSCKELPQKSLVKAQLSFQKLAFWFPNPPATKYRVLGSRYAEHVPRATKLWLSKWRRFFVSCRARLCIREILTPSLIHVLALKDRSCNSQRERRELGLQRFRRSLANPSNPNVQNWIYFLFQGRMTWIQKRGFLRTPPHRHGPIASLF